MPALTLPHGGRIWYRRSGRGPLLLHIHGSAFGHRNFDHLTPLMAERFDVVDFDLPGFGESDPAPHGGGIHHWADDVAAFIKALGGPRPHVHGTSLGGMIGLSLAARHSELVDRVVLSCFLCRYDNAARAARSTWTRAARASGMEAVAELTAVAGFSRGFFEQPDAGLQLARMRTAFAGTEPGTFTRATEALFDLDLAPLAGQVRAPLLVIGGEEDDITPVDPAPSGFGLRQLAERIPGARLEVLPGCGHYMVIEAAEATAACVSEFLLSPSG
jgi:3-oxoadipate enol-lactonase